MNRKKREKNIPLGIIEQLIMIGKWGNEFKMKWKLNVRAEYATKVGAINGRRHRQRLAHTFFTFVSLFFHIFRVNLIDFPGARFTQRYCSIFSQSFHAMSHFSFSFRLFVNFYFDFITITLHLFRSNRMYGRAFCFDRFSFIVLFNSIMVKISLVLFQASSFVRGLEIFARSLVVLTAQ